MKAHSPAVMTVEREQLKNGHRTRETDAVAVEEPLEIRVQGRPVAVLLRTPGHDEDLATGYCLTEQLVADVHQVDRVTPCPDTPAEAAGNVVDVLLHPGVQPDFSRHESPRFSNSACGVCGAATLGQLLRHQGPVSSAQRIPLSQLLAMPNLLRAHQPAFAQTGGLHAAALFGADLRLALVREDVGRHNAADKALGAWAFLHGENAPTLLVMSSRAGFEIVEKAHMRRVPILATVGAPSSLAVSAAHKAGITLVSFLSAQGCNIYTHPQRVVSPDP